MIKIQGKEVQQWCTDITLKMVRTYKGEIERTQTGLIAAFPASFITTGFDLSFLGPVLDMKRLEQVLISNDTLQIEMDYNGTQLKGIFSCTTNGTTQLKDKGERHMQLAVSIVSDGSPITKPNGASFTVKDNLNNTVIASAYFGRTYAIPLAYRTKKLNGYTVGERLLVLGDHTLTD